jgi:hypothetical protein
VRPVHFVVATPLSAAAASLILPLILPLRLAVSVRSRGAFVGAGTTRFAWASKAAKRCRLKTSSGCARFVLACCGLRRPHTAGSNLQLLPLSIELQLSRRLQQQRGGRPRRRLQNAAPAQQSHQCSRTPPRSGGGAGPPHSCQMTGALVRMTRRRTAAKPPGLRLQSVPPSRLAPAEPATAHETGRDTSAEQQATSPRISLANARRAAAAAARRAVQVSEGQSLSDRGSTFQALLAPCTSIGSTETTLRAIAARADSATTRSYAWRITETNDEDGSMEIVERYDDGGEHGAGERLLQLLQRADVRNVCLVVARWFGANHSGDS